MSLFWFLIVAAVVLGVVGVAADGLGYLVVIAVVVLVVDLVYLGMLLGRRRGGRRPTR